jgi:hypothetical protein
LLPPLNKWKHFVNHSSALHPRYALELFEKPVEHCPAVPTSDVEVKIVIAAVSAVELSKDGTEVQVTIVESAFHIE